MKHLLTLALCAALLCVGISAAHADSATPAPVASAPSHVGTVVTTAGVQKTPGYAVDLFRWQSVNISAIALDAQSRVPFTIGVSVMSKGGESIGLLKLPEPSPVPGANRFGTWGVFIETRL